MSATPITELPNELTSNLDVAGPLGILRLFRTTDAQIFSGYKAFDSLYDKIPAMEKTAKMADHMIKNADRSVIVMCGSGTSGRIAFLAARNMNRCELVDALRMITALTVPD
jgi:N-acetylmuramic acid 6-phosphate (MurNAc-6-P) etherase